MGNVGGEIMRRLPLLLEAAHEGAPRTRAAASRRPPFAHSSEPRTPDFFYCHLFPFVFSLLSNVNGVVCGFSRSSLIAPATAGSLSFQMSRPRVMSDS